MNITLHPAYLWIGPSNILKNKAENFIKSILGENISVRKHHLVSWLEPENYYTVSQLDSIFSRISYALQPDEHFFFVIERADLLQHSGANSLLKSLEEPPPGYHFLLLTPIKGSILPTIVSRCILEQIDSDLKESSNSLLPFFQKDKIFISQDIIKEAEKLELSEYDMVDFLDQLILYWQSEYRKEASQRILQIISVVENSRKKLPPPGSMKSFLKNLVLQLAVV